MSKNTLVKELRRELHKLNAEIDLKIIKGLPYKAESRRHKFIVSQLASLNRLNGAVESGWFVRMGRLVSAFML